MIGMKATRKEAKGIDSSVARSLRALKVPVASMNNNQKNLVQWLRPRDHRRDLALGLDCHHVDDDVPGRRRQST